MELNLENIKTQLFQALSESTSASISLKSTPQQSFQDHLKENQIAHQVHLNTNLERIIKIFERFMGSRIAMEEIKPVVILIQKSPVLAGPLIDFLSTLKVGDGEDQERKLALGLKVIHSWARQLSQDLPKDHPYIVQKFGREPKLLQWIRVATSLLQGIKPGTHMQNQPTAVDVLQWMAATLKEAPKEFERQLFALPLLLKSGFSLEEVQALSQIEDPIEVMRILIAVLKNSGEDLQGAFNSSFDLKLLFNNLLGKKPLHEVKALNAVVSQVRTLLNNDPQQLLPLLEQLKRSLNLPIRLLSSVNDPASKSFHWPEEGIVVSRLGEEKLLPIQAVTQNDGLLPDDMLVVKTSAQEIALRGSMITSALFPLGFHRILIKKKGKADAFWELLLYVVRGKDEQSSPQEDQSGTTDHKNDEKVPEEFEVALNEFTGPDQVDIKPTLLTPLSGEISFQLNAPFLLTQAPFKKVEQEPSPLYVSFHFLADVVCPQTRFSKNDYLTLESSAACTQLRTSIQQLSQVGLKGFNEYSLNLDRFFESLKGVLPKGLKSVDQAKRFLRDEVLTYLMGKEKEDKNIRMGEVSDEGDVVASILGTTGGLSALGRGFSDALISFKDATEWAKTKPFFMQRLDEFFFALKQNLLNDKKYREEFSPVMVPQRTDMNDKGVKDVSALTHLFLNNVKIK